MKKRKYPCFRCPDCWLGLYSDEAIQLHRQRSQGGCFDVLPRHIKESIRRYRDREKITVPPPPANPNDDFEIFED